MTEASAGVEDIKSSEVSTDSCLKINFLAPETLLIVQVSISGRKARALIDTGATRSLLKHNFSSNLRQESTDHPSVMVGLGGSKVSITGMSRELVSIVGMSFDIDCSVVPFRESDQYDIILGVDFLRKHKFSVNLHKRRLSVKQDDDSLVNVYYDSHNEVEKVMLEKIPVYCANDTETGNKLNRVPVDFDIVGCDDDNLFYFEADNAKVQSLDGVFAGKENFQVLVETTGKKGKVKKGQLLGHIYSVVTMEEDEGELNEYGEWTADKIRSDIVLLDNLNENEKDEVRKMLLRMKPALSKGDNDIGKATVQPHRIEVTQATPIWQKPRSFSQPVNEEIENQCSELLAHDILEYSDSDYSAPVVPIRKVDGKLRLCVDYRQINQVTKKENYPMPNLMNCIYRPNKVNFFTKIDLVRGYYQVPIEEESRKYTAFSTPQHHYQFKRLSFGLKNSGMAFQKVMQQILAPLLTSNIIIYIDDILIMSASFKEHIEIVGKVLRLLMEYKIKVKVSKCELFRDEVTFLGHVINRNGIRKSPEFVEKVNNAKKPETVREMRKFLGLVNFQRKFVKNCSMLTAPLTKWTVGNKGKKIEWNDDMEQAFVTLKKEVVRDVLLSYPDYSEGASKMELFVDASGTGCGAYLMQRQQEYKVIAYASMTFSDTQRRYSATDRELAALRWGIKNFRCFLAGAPFILVTDCKPLIYLNSMASTNSRLMRTLEEMAEFDFELKYRPGIDNEAADYLSRMNSDQNVPPEDELHDYKFLPKEVKLIREVLGGGDSLFDSLLITMKDAKENGEYEGEIPGSNEELRSKLVEELARSPVEYGLSKGKQMRQRLKMMLKVGQQPVSEVLLAAGKLYGLSIMVYHGMKSPMLFAHSDSSNNSVVRLQCISQTHYNPLYERKKIEGECIEERYKNLAVQMVHDGETYDENSDCEEYDLKECFAKELHCNHTVFHTTGKVGNYPEGEYCCLLDTGAQVSLVSERVIRELNQSNEKIEIKGSNNTLVGIGEDRQKVNGHVHLQLNVKGYQSEYIPFAIVSESAIPCCFLLGANFIKANGIELDFSTDQLVFNKVTSADRFEINIAFALSSEIHRFRITNQLSLGLDEESDLSDVYPSENDNEDDCTTARYMISQSDLITMQKGNHALRKLRSKLMNKIPTNTGIAMQSTNSSEMRIIW